MPEQSHMEAVARLFEVLSDVNRLAILQSLREQPHAVGQLVDQLKLSQPMVSKHLAVLYEAGLLHRERRRTHVFYSIREPMVFKLWELVTEKLRADAEHQVRLFNSN
ncbi:unnamed protein product [Phaeothamnion confervicola]